MVPEEDRSVLTRSVSPPDEVIAYGPGAEHLTDVRHGAGADDRPLVLFIHGGFWRPPVDRGHTGPLGHALARAGWTTAAIEYRRIPGQPDETPADIAAALTAVPSLVGHHNGRTIVAGHSAGGHLALWVASRSPSGSLCGVLALAPVADLQMADDLGVGEGACRAFVGGPAAQRPDLDPTRLPSPTVPTAIVHATTDSIVPLELSRSYVAAHRSVGLTVTSHGGHFGLIDPLSPAWPITSAELSRLAEAAQRER